MAQLQAHIDTFDAYYNTEREHQALPPGMTPTDAWNATATADPPLPPAHAPRRDFIQLQRIVQAKGVVRVAGTRYQIGNEHSATTVHIVHNDATVTFYDTTGTPIISYPLAAKGTSYVGNGKSCPPQLRTLSTKS